jgi:hypothetical protein
MHCGRGRRHGSAGDGGCDSRSEKRLSDARHGVLRGVKSGLAYSEHTLPNIETQRYRFIIFRPSREPVLQRIRVTGLKFLRGRNCGGSRSHPTRLMPTMAPIESSD